MEATNSYYKANAEPFSPMTKEMRKGFLELYVSRQSSEQERNN